MMTTTNPNTAFKTTDSLIKTATKHPHNHIADTSARNTRNAHTRSLWQRSLVAIALLVTCALGVKAEKYVIYYQDGDTKYYMANVGGKLTSATTYNATTCVWDGTSGSTFSNSGNTICFVASTNNEKKVTLTGNERKLTIGNGQLIYYDGDYYDFYIYYKNGEFYNSNLEAHYGNTRVKAEVEKATPPADPDDDVLVEAKNNAKNTLQSKKPGAAVCKYTYTVNGQPATEASLIEAAIDNATTIGEVNAIVASAIINQPVPGKYYRIKSNTSGNYLDGVNCYNGTNRMGLKSEAERSEQGSIFYLDEDYCLQNLATQTYTYNTHDIGATKANAESWTFTESTHTSGCLTLTSNYSGSKELHDSDGNRADRCSIICGERHDFVLEEVTLDTPEPQFIASKDFQSFTLTCSANEGTIYYTTNGSDPTDPANNPTTLTVGHSATFSATSGITVKAYAHRESYGPSAVVTQVMNIIAIDTAEKLAAITGSGIYVITADITVTSPISITDFTGLLDGGYYTISGLTTPLFTSVNGATIRNVVLDQVSITGGTGNVGAIVGTASGATRIYNCGVLSGNISGTSNVGSIAGSIEGSARVINCYSFANITSGNTVGGIVGNNTIASNAGNLQTLVMNCMFYGDITGGTSRSPIYGGAKISNHGAEGNANGINNYNYYRYEANITPTVYNCALAAEERYLTRFEFYRHVLNSQRKLCAFYVTGDVNDYDLIAKWVLDTADPNAPEYPILKPWGKYASMMNRATTDRRVSTLAVTIEGTNATGATISATTTLDITNAAPNIYDYNHYKVQLPYYNDHFTDNYTNNKVVTGWKITSITNGTAGTFSTTGDDRYNFADRNCTQKDLYDVSGRVFAQGGYFNVPEGVTAIKIEPYWGKAVYLSDKYHDVVYDNGTGWGFIQAGETDNVYNNDNTQTVWHSLDNIWAQLQLNTSAKSVYDNAVVLVGNYHSFDESWSNGTTPFTVMSVDENRDNEPDYGLYCRTSGRIAVNPIRFDFINHVGIGMAAKEDGRSEMYNLAIWEMKGWFELTETALAIYEEFEYDASAQNKVSAPLILNGGIFKQFGSTAFRTYEAVKTPYAIVGGNCYLYKYSPGCNTNTSTPTNTKFPPVSILGGECEEFYLSGGNAAPTPYEGYNALCYGNGGKIGTFAGAYQEAIDGDVIIKLDHMLIGEFYGGGVNDKKPITGNIYVTINNSQVGTYCGGPKFGNMATDKAITTYAENTTFDRFFGAGYGGTSLFRGSNADYSRNPYPTEWLNTYYTNRRGYYYDGTTRFENRFNPIGILVGYETEFFSYAGGGSPNARFYTDYASLSVAEVRNVTSTLIGCTINGDLYGGGNLGKANGDISTTLERCIVMGSAYAAGFSAAVPTCEVMPTTPPTTYSTYNANTGIYSPAQYPAPVIYTWAQAKDALVNGQKYLDDDKKLIYTKAVDLSDLGTVRGNTTIKIKGNSHIHGSVFGGGNASKVIGNTHVHIQGGTIDGNVFGAGNQAEVTGKTEVLIGQ